ncbi:hypothetical protein [Streptomyces sp. NPDC058572]|uniref:effector-associated constant component EACC1 n=1 Tax=Streptomyces sp. NPDC058572 TaxID=3346546 RepID=UPI003653F5AA
MRVRIEVEGDAGDELDQSTEDVLLLYRWLSSDPDVANGGGLALVPCGADGEAAGTMGPGLDAVEAVINGSVQLAQLALAVATWRLARTHPPRIRIERGGTTVTLDGDDPEWIRRVVSALDEPDAGPDPDRIDGPTPPASPE